MRRRDNSFRFSDLTLTAVEKWKDSRQCDVESSEIIGSGLPNHRRAPNGPILEIVLLMLIISKIQCNPCPHTVLDMLLLTVELCEDGEHAPNFKIPDYSVREWCRQFHLTVPSWGSLQSGTFVARLGAPLSCFELK